MPLFLAACKIEGVCLYICNLYVNHMDVYVCIFDSVSLFAMCVCMYIRVYVCMHTYVCT